MIKKRFYIGCLLVSALLVGCITTATARVLKDETGVMVKMPDHPKRIVALAPSTAEIIFSLGAGNRLVGTTEYSSYPKAAEKIPRVGSFVRLDIERILALEPDLCIATKDGNPERAVLQLRELGIPVFVISPQNIEETMQALLTIGIIIDEKEKAEILVADMKKRISRIEKKIATVQTKPRVFFQIGFSPIVAVGKNTFGDEIIRKVGGINVASGKTSYPRYSREQIIACRPDVLIVANMGNPQPALDAEKEWKKWKDLPAVKNNRVHLVESDLYNRPTYRLIFAIEEMARIVHPELFGKASK